MKSGGSTEGKLILMVMSLATIVLGLFLVKQNWPILRSFFN